MRINAPRLAATWLIAPRLGRFRRALPGVVLDLVVDDGVNDVVAGRFDVGIRTGERLDKDMIAVRLTGPITGRLAADRTRIPRIARGLLMRGLPSEGRGPEFESRRVRQLFQ